MRVLVLALPLMILVNVTGRAQVDQVHTLDTLKTRDFLKWQQLVVDGLDYRHGEGLAIQQVSLQQPQRALQPLPSGTVPVTPSTGTRRSLVAAKVYLSGMLELQRDPEAAHHRGRLQARLDDEALLEALADAYGFLEGRVAPTLAGRIRDRLFEALPHAPLRRMQALLDARADASLS